ncbi:MFS transporter [Sorangium sp. So ce1182]|uniref:MFS transporter n=1 Tax=Sorangium sp. So ce1182 TaxID=3133334 RepID=UPI003F5DC153
MSTATLEERSLPSRWSDKALRQTAGYYALFICLGLITAITGPTLPDLARQTGSSVGDMGSIFLGGGVGYTLGTLWGGKLFDRVHGHTLLGGAHLAAAACLAAIPAVPWLWLLVVLAFCRGVLEGLVNTGANALLLWTHREKVSPYMNGLHFCFGLGAFVSPLLVARVPGAWGGYRSVYWAVAAFSALIAVSVLLMRHCPEPQEKAGKDAGAQDRSLRLLPVFVAVLYLFAYVGGEISFGSWIYTYALTLGVVSAAGAAYLTSAFWFSFTIGRLISIPVAIRFTPRQVIPGALAGCLVLSALMLFLPSSSAMLWGVSIGLGLFMAPLWPSGFTLTGQIVPMTAFVTGLVLVGDSLGGMVLPAMTGKLIEGVGLDRLAYSLPLLVFGSMVACALTYVALLFLGRRAGEAPAVSAAREGAGH